MKVMEIQGFKDEAAGTSAEVRLTLTAGRKCALPPTLSARCFLFEKNLLQQCRKNRLNKSFTNAKSKSTCISTLGT